jgi:tetratricopeptide (TPR) repeat protein
MRAVSTHLYLARGLRQLGLASLAAKAYRGASEADRACFEACFGRGEALARGGRWNAATAAFREAAALRPADVDAQGSLVLALYRSGKLEPAAVAMRRLIDLRPGEPDLYLALGMIQCRMGRPWEAIPTFRWATRLPPQPTARRLALGDALFGERAWMDVRAHLDGIRDPFVLPAVGPRRDHACLRVSSRWRAVASILGARVRSPRALSAAARGLAACGYLVLARAFTRWQPSLAIRSLRAARRFGAA